MEEKQSDNIRQQLSVILSLLKNIESRLDKYEKNKESHNGDGDTSR